MLQIILFLVSDNCGDTEGSKISAGYDDFQEKDILIILELICISI